MPHPVTRRILAAVVNLTQTPLKKKPEKTPTKREPPVPKQPKRAPEIA